jgi:hypothetical protein
VRVSKFFVISLAALALGVAAGCGDDDSSAAGSLTKAEFVEQGDAICKKANEKGSTQLIAYLKSHAGTEKPLTKEQEKELVSTVIVPLLEKQIDGLNQLGTPEEGEEEAQALIAELEDILAEAKADPIGTAASGGPFAESEKKAKELGFKECGHN